jgi:hypothetical protein
MDFQENLYNASRDTDEKVLCSPTKFLSRLPDRNKTYIVSCACAVFSRYEFSENPWLRNQPVQITTQDTQQHNT